MGKIIIMCLGKPRKILCKYCKNQIPVQNAASAKKTSTSQNTSKEAPETKFPLQVWNFLTVEILGAFYQ